MARLQSGTRIYGNAVIDTNLSINGNSGIVDATSNITGALKVAGGIGVTGNVFSSGIITSNNANLGNLVIANYFTGTLTTNAQPNITSVGTLTGLSVNGNTTITGNLVVTGNTTYVNSNITQIEDRIIELGGGANGATLSTDDNLDRGISVHYFKSTAKTAFFGLANDTLDFEYYVDGTETGGVFSGTYGNIKGLVFISTATTGTSPFIVNSTTEVANLTAQYANIANKANTANTVTVNAQPNITSVGTLSSLTVNGITTLGNIGNVKIYGGAADYVLKTDGTGNLSWVMPATGAGTGNANVSGSNTQLQYNDGTNLGSSANLTFNAVTKTLTVDNIVANGSGLTSITGANVTGTVANANYAAYAGNAFSVTGSNVVGAVNLANYATVANSVAGANVTGAVSYATTANSVAGANVSGIVANANYASYAGNAFSVTGSNVVGAVNLANYATVSNSVAGANVSGEVAYANVANNVAGANVSGQVSNALVAGTVYTNAQPNITSVGTLSSLTVSGLLTATGTGIKVSNIQDSTGTIAITTKYNNNVGDVGITGNLTVGTSGTGNVTANYFIGDGSKLTNLNTSSILSGTATFVTSNISNVVAGSTVTVVADYSNSSYPGGVFTIAQLGPVSLSMTDVWKETSSATKNAYANYLANSVNVNNVNVTFSLSNATFSVQSSDYILIGSANITGANLTGLNITGNSGTYTIPSTYISNTVEITTTNAVSAHLTTTRGVYTATGTTLTATQPVAFTVNSVSGSFPSSTVPYFSLNQAFNWSVSVTGTASAGNLTYTGGVSLTNTGATSGTSGSIDSTSSYTLTTSDYYGAGLYGYGSRTIPSTVTGTVSAATKYYPLFYKITSSSSIPTLTTSDSYLTHNYVLGDGATTSGTTSQYLWIATPTSTSHTFAYTFLGSQVGQAPAVTSTQTISGYSYNIYGFTNFSVATFLYTVT